MTIPEEIPEEASEGGETEGAGGNVEEASQSDLPPEAVPQPEPPPLPRPPERPERPRVEPIPKPAVRRLTRSLGIALPRNRYRVFLGKGAIPPVTESKHFVAPLAEINRVRIKVLEGDDEQADRNDLIGEIGLSNIRLREDGRAELEIEFSLTATGVLTVRLMDRIGDTESIAKWTLTQFKEIEKGEEKEEEKAGKKDEKKEEIEDFDLRSLPVSEIFQKIELLEEQMRLLKAELEARKQKEQ